jgi:peptidoglycan/LPS O-acetylase OafA/YrhL
MNVASATRMAPPGVGRFAFIDGLRGVAAMAVVLFHFFTGPQEQTLRDIFPRVVSFALAHGALGVQIFFVISGFVISRSLMAERLTLRFAANFALRRQIRLDPPYWATLFIATVNLYVPWIMHRERVTALPPSTGRIVAHVFYAHNILGLGDIVPVFWTLCIEVQFYTFLICLVALQNRLPAGARGAPRDTGTLLLFGTFLISLAYMIAVDQTGPWFIAYWYMFALGDASSRFARGTLGAAPLGAMLGLAVVAGVVVRAPEPFVAAATSGAIAIATRTNGLQRWLRGRVVQYLGAISYSLYLVHYDIGFRFLNAGYKLTGTRPLPALGWFLAAILASILGAHVLNVLVEKPSVRLAAWVRQSREARARAARVSAATEEPRAA